MNYKALAYFVLIIFTGVSSLFFFFNSLGKNRKRRFISGKWSLLTGIILLIITIITGIDFTQRVYNKMKTTVVSLQNFPETVDTQSSDTTDYVRALKKYEPEKYKGKIPEDYYRYYGFRDYWHFPLVYPYAISCIDLLDRGEIENDSGRTNFEEGSVKTIPPVFDSFTFDADHFAGKIFSEKSNSPVNEQYFILNFSDGRKENFISKESLLKKLDEIKFRGERNFISIREYSQRF